MTIKWLIVDYGGVLARDHLDAPESKLAAVFHCTRRALRQAITERSMAGKAIRLDQISEDEFWSSVSRELCGCIVPITSPELTKMWFGCYQLNLDMVSLILYAEEKGIKFGVATNVDRYREVHMSFQLHKIISKTPNIFASWRIGYIKPDALYFKSISRQLSKSEVAPNEILYLDDRVEHAEAAAAEGWQALAYVDTAEFRQKIRNIIVLGEM